MAKVGLAKVGFDREEKQPGKLMGPPDVTLRAGTALQAARRNKERKYPELAGRGGRARLVVVGAEVRDYIVAENNSSTGVTTSSHFAVKELEEPDERSRTKQHESDATGTMTTRKVAVRREETSASTQRIG